MIRIEKSSKARTAEYMLLYRISKLVGKKTVADAVRGNQRALARIEKLAYEPHKRPAVVAWLKNHRARLKRESVQTAG